jgi:DNA polymerase II large subunit
LNPKMSKEYRDYVSSLNEQLNTIHEIAERARAKGFDPYSKPETEIAEDLAGLVEGFIGPSGVAERIRELSGSMPREEVAFKIAEEIVYGRFGHLEEREAADQAIRTAVAILTEGVTAAVYSEGIAKVSIKSNPDRSRYLAVYFAGPISSAGGTEKALTPVIADFVRRLLGLDRYKPTEDEIQRFIEELRLYEREVGRFQYHVSDEQISRALEYLPVEVTGTQSNPVEVSSLRNLPRIETNGVRGGALMLVNDGIVGRSAKVLAVVQDLRIQGWDWLKDIREIQTKISSGFMEDVPAGRPILSFPSRTGGFRPRYGRARNTGLAAVGVHPLTMSILKNFIAGGTQLKIETPGKSGIVLPVDAVEPPIVRLKDGSVVRVTQENIAEIREKNDKILFLGDLLISFGDFLYNKETLLPSGYTEEWWREELNASIGDKFEGSIEDAAKLTEIPLPNLEAFLDHPFGNRPTPREAIMLSRILEIPLHPFYTYFWSNITIEELDLLRRWLLSSRIKTVDGLTPETKRPLEGYARRILEKLCIPFKVTGNDILIEGDTASAFTYSLGVHSKDGRIDPSKTVLENLEKLSGLMVRDKAPSFIGARVGRPEKAKKRQMKPPVHALFPVGLSGGSQRNLVKASEKAAVTVELAKRRCPQCQTATFKRSCPNCGSETEFESVCPRCGRGISESVCPVCKVSTRNFERQFINIRKILAEACERVGFTASRVKGVRGLTNKTKTPEMIEKGILRAKYDLSVYKDGTVRFDVTNAPLTHFKPSEIGTSVERLKELGYYHDYEGNPLFDPEQICELKVQDVVIPQESVGHLISVANFVDELLQKVYGLKPCYNADKPEDLIGLLVVGLAPHTCAGVLGRIIGSTRLNVCYAHPFWHSAKRRDCDGDEDTLLLALDVFLNFSKAYLPARIGGSMDSPLFVIRLVNPKEVQRQAQEMDVTAKYPLTFYERTLQRVPAKETVEVVDIVKHRLDTEAQFEGLNFTVPVSNVNSGNRQSVYKTLKSMKDKLKGQLRLAEMIEAVDAKEVAEIVLTSHFMRDISGNLRAFTTQKFRCKKCNKSYRRIPLKGRCQQCGGELTLTVHRGGIEKYLQDAQELVDEYGLSEYYTQRLSLVQDEINSLFESGIDFKQSNLAEFLSS